MSNNVLRVVYLPPRVYDRLQAAAQSEKATFSEVFEQYLVLGMMAYMIVPSGKF